MNIGFDIRCKFSISHYIHPYITLKVPSRATSSGEREKVVVETWWVSSHSHGLREGRCLYAVPHALPYPPLCPSPRFPFASARHQRNIVLEPASAWERLVLSGLAGTAVATQEDAVRSLIAGRCNSLKLMVR